MDKNLVIAVLLLVVMGLVILGWVFTVWWRAHLRSQILQTRSRNAANASYRPVRTENDTDVERNLPQEPPTMPPMNRESHPQTRQPEALPQLPVTPEAHREQPEESNTSSPAETPGGEWSNNEATTEQPEPATGEWPNDGPPAEPPQPEAANADGPSTSGTSGVFVNGEEW